MKKLLLIPVLLLSLLFVTTSCEDNDSDSKSSNTYLQEEFVQFKGHDNTPSGVVYHTSDGKYDVMCDNSRTLVMEQRESCSGFSEGSMDATKYGGYADIKFTEYDIDWSSKPYKVIPSEIWIYRKECLYPVNDDTNCVPCQQEQQK